MFCSLPGPFSVAVTAMLSVSVYWLPVSMVCLHLWFAFAGLTVAEHFRDAEGQDVLLFIDNIFRFTQVIWHWQLYCCAYLRIALAGY